LIRLDLKERATIGNEGLGSLSNLTSLSLMSEVSITAGVVSRLTGLRSLFLKHNRSLADNGLFGLSNLTTLSLERNATISNCGISQLVQLRSLSLAANAKITDNALSLLTNLTWLDLYDGQLITDKSLSCLSNLRTLDLRGRARVSGRGVAPSQSSLTALHLDAYSEWITNADLSRMTNLEVLSLPYNHTITNIGIMNLWKLKSLNLNYNLRITIEGLVGLSYLASLDLRGNVVILDGLSQLVSLKTLRLDHHAITNETISGLSNLTTLSLVDYRSGGSVLGNAALRGLSNLTYLKYSTSRMQLTSGGISHLTRLSCICLQPRHGYLRHFVALADFRQFLDRVNPTEVQPNS
jgi:hypothetical protein